MKNNKKVIIYFIMVNKQIILYFIIVLVLFFCIRYHKSQPNIITYKQQPIELTETKTINDTIPIIYIELEVNQDSIDRVKFIKDSTEFARTCKAINGGYNGYQERYAIWLRARNILKNKKQ